MQKFLNALFLDEVEKFIHALTSGEQGKIAAAIAIMRTGDFKSVYTKTLRGQIKELKVREYRLIFFIKHQIIYFVGVFTKKSAKTPKKQIENAQKIYNQIKN